MEIKETKELLIGVNELSLALVAAFKDGIQPVADFSALYVKYTQDAAFKAKVDAAFAGATGPTGVLAEAKEISFNEGLELAKVQLDYLPKILSALKAV